MAHKSTEGRERMASKSTQDRTLTLHYGKKDWFVTVCGLNGRGLIPGQTLTEAHTTKQECVEMFGDRKSNNGYKTSKNPGFIDHVNWLWKRVHQVDKPVSNDVGFHFCQGLIYEHHHGLDTVDWAELAVTTVNWYRGSKGLKKMHHDWAHAFPSITIDLFTKQPVHENGDEMYLEPSLEIIAAKFPTTSSQADEAKRKRIDNGKLQSNSSRDIKSNNTSGTRVKQEYVKTHVSHAPMEFHTGEIPLVDIQNVEIPTAGIPNMENPMPEPTPCPTKKMAPKAFGGSNGVTCACTPSFLTALQLFRIDIERAIDMRIKNLEKEKARLKSVMDDTRHDVDIATAAVKDLLEELETTQSTLANLDTDENRGEVRCLKSALKSGEAKLNSKKEKYNGVSLEWRLQANLLTKKCQS